MPGKNARARVLSAVAVASTLAVGGAIAAPAAYAAPSTPSVRAGVLEDLLGDLNLGELEAFLGTLTEGELTDLLEQLLDLDEFDLAGLLDGLDLEGLETILDALDSGDLQDLVEELLDTVDGLLEQLLGGLTEGELTDLFDELTAGPLGDLLEDLLESLGLGDIDELIDELLGADGAELTDLVNDLLDGLGLEDLLGGLVDSLGLEDLVQQVVDLVNELLGDGGIGDVLTVLEDLNIDDLVQQILEALGLEDLLDSLGIENLLENIVIVEPIIEVINEDNENEIEQTDVPEIEGTEQYTKVLTADPGNWDATGFTFEWFRDGEPIEGAVNPSYRLKLDDIGTFISVEVTGYKTDAEPRTEASGTTDAIEKARFAVSAKPKVTGNPKVGKKVIAKGLKAYGDDVTFTYRWLKNSNNTIKGATSKSYKIKKSANVHKIRVKVTASAPGYVDSTDLSKKVTVKKK